MNNYTNFRLSVRLTFVAMTAFITNAGIAQYKEFPLPPVVPSRQPEITITSLSLRNGKLLIKGTTKLFNIQGVPYAGGGIYTTTNALTSGNPVLSAKNEKQRARTIKRGSTVIQKFVYRATLKNAKPGRKVRVYVTAIDSGSPARRTRTRFVVSRWSKDYIE